MITLFSHQEKINGRL